MELQIMQLKEGMNEWYKQKDITKFFGQTFMYVHIVEYIFHL